MRILKTAIPIEDGSQLVCDTIQHDGKLWLAPDWIGEASRPYRKPARLIGLSGLKYRSMPMRSEVDFIVDHPIPRAVLEGRVQGERAEPFVILERPDIRILNSVLTAVFDRDSSD